MYTRQKLKREKTTATPKKSKGKKKQMIIIKGERMKEKENNFRVSDVSSNFSFLPFNFSMRARASKKKKKKEKETQVCGRVSVALVLFPRKNYKEILGFE